MMVLQYFLSCGLQTHGMVILQNIDHEVVLKFHRSGEQIPHSHFKNVAVPFGKSLQCR